MLFFCSSLHKVPTFCGVIVKVVKGDRKKLIKWTIFVASTFRRLDDEDEEETTIKKEKDKRFKSEKTKQR